MEVLSSHQEPTPTPPTVLLHIVEDDAIVRASLEDLVRGVAQHVAAHDSAEAFLAAYEPLAPSALLLDVTLPRMNGLELLEHLDRHHLMLPTIVLSADAEVQRVVSAIRSGAVDFMTKPPDPRRLLHQVEALLANAEPEARIRRQALQYQQGYDGLTPREREVFLLVAQGATTKQIALKLGLQLRTAHIHRTNVMRKFETETTVELAHIAYQLRVLN
ncbi:MAG: response regulator [Planctomycetota bacterium]